MRLIWLAIIFLMLMPMRASAWNHEGHRLIGHIAAARLTPEAKRDIEQLFGEPAANVLPAVATWADTIVASRPETRPWHYVNIPRRADGFDRHRDCHDGACVIAAIEQQIEKLRAADANISSRREALMFIVHFVGDMHQPLHCGDGSDRGGNDIHVEYEGQRTNLHRLWDGEFFPWAQLSTDSDREDHDNYAFDGGALVRWADESHRSAIADIYSTLPATRPDRTIGLTEHHLARFWSIAQHRIHSAGHRLASLLNTILGSDQGN